jgi:hypothetical protein
MNSGSQGGEYEDEGLLVHGAVKSRRSIPTFSWVRTLDHQVTRMNEFISYLLSTYSTNQSGARTSLFDEDTASTLSPEFI